MEEVVIYQKGKNFVFTRRQSKDELDAEELLRNLNKVREQLKEMKSNIDEFERDIKVMEEFESLAKTMRDEELTKAKKDIEQTK